MIPRAINLERFHGSYRSVRGARRGVNSDAGVSVAHRNAAGLYEIPAAFGLVSTRQAPVRAGRISTLDTQITP